MKVTKQADRLIIELDHQAEVVAFRWALGNGPSPRARELRKAILDTKHTEASADVLMDILEKAYNTFVSFELPVETPIAGPVYCQVYDTKAPAEVVDRRIK